MIEGFLVPKGVDQIAAAAASGELIDHCSKRAWILSKVSTVKNVSYFSFTHRTFFEFFTAEALIRKISRGGALGLHQSAFPNDTLSPVSREILNAYRTDSTSVLPELLLQAAEDLMDGMSTPVLEELQREAARPAPTNLSTNQGAMQAWQARPDLLSLCIRLVAAGGASSTIVDRIFDLAERKWSGVALGADKTDDHGKTLGLSDIRRLLEISEGHRERFVTRCIDNPDALGRFFLQRYARLLLIGEAGLFDERWRECAETVARKCAQRNQDPIDVWFRVETGIISVRQGLDLARGSDLLALTVEGARYAGLLWRALYCPELVGHDYLLEVFSRIVNEGATESLDGYPLADFAELAKGAEASPNHIPQQLALLLILTCSEQERARLAGLLGQPRLVETASRIDAVESRARSLMKTVDALCERLEREDLDYVLTPETLQVLNQDYRACALNLRKAVEIPDAKARNWLAEKTGILSIRHRLKYLEKSLMDQTLWRR